MGELEVIIKEFPLEDAASKEIFKNITELQKKAKSWEKLSELEITDTEDKATMQSAKTNRLSIKKDRSELKKYLSEKRNEIQKAMSHYKNEDTAYLRVIQHFETLAKEQEAKLKEVEDFAETKEAERLERLEEERLEKLEQVCDDPSIYPVKQMSEEAFDNFYNSLKVSKETLEKEEAEKAKIEAENQKNADLLAERKDELAPYMYLDSEDFKLKVSEDTSEDEYKAILKKAKDRAKELQVEQEAESLLITRKESLSKYKYLEDEVEDFSLEITKGLEDKKFESLKAKAEKLHKEKLAEKETLEKQAEKLRKKEAKEKAEKKKLEEQEAKLKVAGDKTKIETLIKSFVPPDAHEVSDKQYKNLQNEIFKKFEGFKNWAKKELKKLD